MRALLKSLNTASAAVVFGLSFMAGFASAAPVTLTASGATFPFPIYAKWIDAFQKVKPDVRIAYQPVGSGAGIHQVTEGSVDFGASDGPMNDVQIRLFVEKHGAGVMHFPTVVGADVATYNLPGVSAELNFTPEILAGIFLGKITRWNDPEIIKANLKVKFPGNAIVVAHRSDESGTTYVWADYLCKVSLEWRDKIGRSTWINWPVGQGAEGNAGVAALVKRTPYSIGYVELSYAIENRLTYANVRNSSGVFVKPSLVSVTAAANAAAKFMPDDFRFSISNSPGKTAYPIASFTWLLIPKQIKDRQKLEALKDFLRWMLGPGQELTESLHYAKLPKEIVAQEIDDLTLIH
jgi:phosphate transport system substrate-binding protein